MDNEEVLNEKILFEVLAKLRVRGNGFLGSLGITESQIIFTSSPRGEEPFALLMPWKDIAEYKTYNFLGFIPNRILIKLTSGAELHFMVSKRKELMETLNAFIPEKNVSN